MLCNLATHTAGFPPTPRNLKRWTHPKNPYVAYQQNELYNYLANHPSHPVISSFGIDYRHSLIGMALLGDVLSHKARTSFEDLLQQQVLSPLNLQDTYITPTYRQQSRLVQGHTKKGKEASPWRVEVLAPSIGVHSSMQDMMHFLSAHMSLSDSSWIPTMKLTQNHRNKISSKEHVNAQASLGWIIRPLSPQAEMIWQQGQTGALPPT